MTHLLHFLPAALTALCRRRRPIPLPYPPPPGLVARQWWHQPPAR